MNIDGIRGTLVCGYCARNRVRHVWICADSRRDGREEFRKIKEMYKSLCCGCKLRNEHGTRSIGRK